MYVGSAPEVASPTAVSTHSLEMTKKLELSSLTSTDMYFPNSLQITITYLKMGAIVLEVSKN